MPELAPVLVAALRAGLIWLGRKAILGGIGSVKDAVIQLGQWIDWLTQVIGDVFAAAKGAENYSEAWATEAGQQIAEMGQDIKQITEHTYQVVIPGSQSWLAGYVMVHWIDPIRSDLVALHKAVNQLGLAIAALQRWRQDRADPLLNQWAGFHAWFTGWPQGVLFRWHEWFAKPAEFGAWAAAPVAGPLIAYLADPQHKTSRDNLSAIMADAWRSEPQVIWDAMLDWLVS